MILVRLGQWCVCLLLVLSSVLHAAEMDSGLGVDSPGFSPPQSTQANWVFSGMVSNENSDRYAYFFQMQRHENQFHVVSALFDAQNKVLLSMDDGDAIITDPEQFNWHVGRSFLRFNAINNSWIFGMKTQDKKGFNFKVDMLNQPKDGPLAQNLRDGVAFIASQTGQLNGHVQVGDVSEEQFVTAKHAWFRQIWLTNAQDKPHQLSSVLCRFEDGSGFYSMKMPEPDATRGASAGWFNAEGASTAMSQFIHVTEADNGAWHIRIASPAMHLVLSDAVKQRAVVTGCVSEKDKQGFCMLSEDAVG